jgi:hypothetical protein
VALLNQRGRSGSTPSLIRCRTHSSKGLFSTTITRGFVPSVLDEEPRHIVTLYTWDAEPDKFLRCGYLMVMSL